MTKPPTSKKSEKKMLGIWIDEQTKKSWKNFIKKENISTLSKMIRSAVDQYIHHTDISELSHKLKQPLTSIIGFSELMADEVT